MTSAPPYMFELVLGGYQTETLVCRPVLVVIWKTNQTGIWPNAISASYQYPSGEDLR
jgi:hypothetical protein